MAAALTFSAVALWTDASIRRQAQLNHRLMAAIDAIDTPRALTLLREGADANSVSSDLRSRTIRDLVSDWLDRITGHTSPQIGKRGTPALILYYAHSWPGDNPPENTELTEALLSHGADVKSGSEYGDLERVAESYGHWKTTLLLLRYGYPSSQVGEAAWEGAAEDLTGNGASELLRYGVDANAGDEDGSTALIAAAKRRNSAMVRVLLHSGVAVDQCNKLGTSALIEAVGFDDLPSVTLLLDRGADVNRVSTEAWYTPLISAVCNRNPIMVRYLLKRVADPNIEHFDAQDASIRHLTWTALRMARENHYRGIANILVRAGERH